jgi:hypothetical protein
MLNNNEFKKNKNKNTHRNNMKIAMRNVDDIDINMKSRKNNDIERLMLERELTFNNSENEINDNYINKDINMYDNFNNNMSINSSYTLKKNKYDNYSNLDFNLYNNNNNNQENIKFNDGYSNTNSNEYSNIKDSLTNITRGTDPYETFITDVNSTTCWMNSNMYKMYKNNKDYVVNGFGLFSSMGLVYLLSNDTLHNELKNYFGYQEKKHINAGILTIRELLNTMRNKLVIDNYLIIDNNIDVSDNTINKIKKVIFSVVINKNNINYESTRINNIIKNISNIDNIISKNTLSRNNISLVSVCRFSPIWYYKIDNIIRKNNNKYIQYINKTFDFFEDTEKQIIEIPTSNDIVFGMIINKKNYNLSTDLKYLNTAINYLKSTKFDRVEFPLINKRYKLRLTNVLKQTGLKMPFYDDNMFNLFPQGEHIDDNLQYTDIIFDTNSLDNIDNNNKYKTHKTFITNKEFEFFVRIRKINNILLMGRMK